MANVVWKEWGYLDLAKNPFWSHFLANDHLLFSSQWRSVTLFFVTEWNALFSWYDQNESLSIRINFNEWKSNKSYRKLPLNCKKRVKQCCQLYFLDAIPCGYEGKLFPFLQPHLHTRYLGTLYLSEFQTKVGNNELEFGT